MGDLTKDTNKYEQNVQNNIQINWVKTKARNGRKQQPRFNVENNKSNKKIKVGLRK